MDSIHYTLSPLQCQLGMYDRPTRIDNSFVPHVLDPVSVPLGTVVVVHIASAGVICFVLRLDIRVVDLILPLKYLQPLLHLLLSGLAGNGRVVISSKGKGHSREVGKTGGRRKK
jgi:hypothetical protein